MMRSIVTIVAVCLLMTAISFAGTPVQPRNVSTTTGDYRQGRQYFPEKEFDFGYIPQGAFVSHSFWILNKGGDSLEIIQVKPG